MARLRIYLDTSVFGGTLDDEFREESEALFSMVHRREIILLVSPLLAAELRRAPPEIQKLFDSIPTDCLEEIPLTKESRELRDLYLEAAVVGKASADDAHHVALATVNRADMIVSWNFKHIVHYDKMRGFNSVNQQAGYPRIEIHSPKEVI